MKETVGALRQVVIVGVTDARVRWPIGKRRRAKSLVVYKGLEQAVRRESKQALCHWFGITPQTASKWRKALGITAVTPGTSRLRREALARHGQAMRAKIDYDSERNAKIAAARRGKPRPPHVIEALRRANRGRRLSAKRRSLLGVPDGRQH